MIKNNYKTVMLILMLIFPSNIFGKDILLQSTTSTKILDFIPISYQYLKNKPE